MTTSRDLPYLTWARENAGRMPICLRGSGMQGRPLLPWLGQGDPALWAPAPECHHERAFVRSLAERLGTAEEQVFPCGGTSGANTAALALLLAGGGELLCERPTYDPLWRTAEAMGASVRFFARRPEDDWRLDLVALESALTHNTRAVVVTRPHNPSGVDVPEGVLLHLGEMAEDNDIHVIVDEVYLPFVADARPAFRIHPRLMSTASLTKVYGLGEQRLGWVAADPGIVARLRERRLHGEALVPSLPFRLALACWSELDGWLAEARQRAAEGAAVVRGGLADFPGLRLALAATPFGFAWWGGDDRAACRELEERGVGVTPGHLFAAPGGVRIGWLRPPAQLWQAVPALQAVLGRQADGQVARRG